MKRPVTLTAWVKRPPALLRKSRTTPFEFVIFFDLLKCFADIDGRGTFWILIEGKKAQVGDHAIAIRLKSGFETRLFENDLIADELDFNLFRLPIFPFARFAQNGEENRRSLFRRG